MKLYGKDLSRAEVLQRVGDISQLGGMKRYTLEDGSSRGVRCVSIKTAAGLDFTIDIDCGMNISSCFYKTVPICWRSGTGEVAPAFYDKHGTGWLRSFNGGLVTTCGLSQIGAPCVDDGEELGLHGRISNTPATLTRLCGEWVDDDYRMVLEGSLREVRALGERLELTRKITAWMGRSEICIEDSVENVGWVRTPHLISYHVNFGFPMLSKTTEIAIKNLKATPAYNQAAKGKGEEAIYVCENPTAGFMEEIFVPRSDPNDDGWAEVAVKNEVGTPIGCTFKYSQETLPNLILWRQFGQGDYVLGFEPANTLIGGRVAEKEHGNVKYLDPQEKARYTLIFYFQG